jgi:hypothetical protein
MKICIICGGEYDPSSNCQKTCSKECKKEKNRRYGNQYNKDHPILRFRKKEYDREYHKKNKEKRNKYAREYHNKHKREREEYIKKNKKKIQIYGQEYYQKNKERRKQNKNYIKFREYAKKDREKYPLHHKARQEAFRKIKIPTEQLCQKCNINGATERHHPDYSKPTEVIFLCIPCHKQIHK